MFDTISIYGVPAPINIGKFKLTMAQQLIKGELKLVGNINDVKIFESTTLPKGEMQLWQGNKLVGVIQRLAKDPFEEKLKGNT